MPNLLFPTKFPYCTNTHTAIPDDINLKLNLKGNDLIYLIAFYASKNKKTTDKQYANKLLNACMKSRTSEWRRLKRLKELKLI